MLCPATHREGRTKAHCVLLSHMMPVTMVNILCLCAMVYRGEHPSLTQREERPGCRLDPPGSSNSCHMWITQIRFLISVPSPWYRAAWNEWQHPVQSTGRASLQIVDRVSHRGPAKTQLYGAMLAFPSTHGCHKVQASSTLMIQATFPGSILSLSQSRSWSVADRELQRFPYT